MATLSSIGEFGVPDSPPMPAWHMVRSLKAGPLTKQGSLFKSWKRRLFILQDSFLLYYVSTSDTSPRGALWIKGCIVREEPEVSRLQSIKTGAPVYCFSLQCAKSWNIEAKRIFKERTYLLLADSFHDQSDWMAIIQTMSRANTADLDLDWEQSYAQTFTQQAQLGGGSSTASSGGSAGGSMMNPLRNGVGGGGGGLGGSAAAGGGSAGASHKRHKSKSGSLGGSSDSSKSIYSSHHNQSHHQHLHDASLLAGVGRRHGASAAAASTSSGFVHHTRQISSAAQGQDSSSGGSGGSGGPARPRTPLASNYSTQSLSSSAAASLLHARDRERERNRYRDADGTTASSTTPPQARGRHLRRGDGGGGSTSGGASLSSGGDDTATATPRQHSLSPSHTHSHSLSSVGTDVDQQDSLRALARGGWGASGGAMRSGAAPGGGGTGLHSQRSSLTQDGLSQTREVSITRRARPEGSLGGTGTGTDSDGEGDLTLLADHSHLPPSAAAGVAAAAYAARASAHAAAAAHSAAASASMPGRGERSLSSLLRLDRSPSTSLLSGDSAAGANDGNAGSDLLQDLVPDSGGGGGGGTRGPARSLTPLAGGPPVRLHTSAQSLTPRQEDLAKDKAAAAAAVAAAGGKDLTPRQHPSPRS